MFKSFRFFMMALAAATLFTACSGEDGDPGAAGDAGAKGDTGAPGTDGADAVSENGYFEGTVKGIRRDGTAFEESFKYSYVFGEQMMYDFETLFQRFETPSGAVADALATQAQNNGLNMQTPLDKGFLKLWLNNDAEKGLTPGNFSIYFSKGLNATQVFTLSAKPYLQDARYNRILELSPELNGIYNFSHGEMGQVGYYTADTDADGKDDANVFDIATSTAYYSFIYDAASGALVSIQTSAGVVTSGDLFAKYSAIKFVYNEEFEQYVFVKASDDTPLYEYVEEVPADQFEITNYTQQNGVITFDYALSISKYRGYMGSPSPMGPVLIHGLNTTNHDMTITGKFSSGTPVYLEAVGRKSE